MCVFLFHLLKDPVQVLILETKAVHLGHHGLLNMLGELLDLSVTPDRSVTGDIQLGRNGGVVGLELKETM